MSKKREAERLLEQAQGGDAEALERLLRVVQPQIYRFSMKMCRHTEDAEDVLQDSMMTLARSFRDFRGASSLSTWLFTIARNLGLNEIRRRTRHPADSLDETHPDNDSQPRHVVEDFTSPIPAEAALSDELHARVEEAIRDLPEKQRTALLLCREGGVSYEEIAEILGGISLTAVKSIIFRGRAVLKARLKPYLESGEWQKK